jgi:hypothetical protein
MLGVEMPKPNFPVAERATPVPEAFDIYRARLDCQFPCAPRENCGWFCRYKGVQLSSETFYAIIEALRSDNKGTKTVEKRQRPRVGLRARADIRVIGPHGPGDPVSIHVRDLSKSGIGLMHNAALPPGTRFVLCFNSKAEGESQKLMFRVAQCRSFGDGCFAIGARLCSAEETAASEIDDLAERLRAVQG